MEQGNWIPVDKNIIKLKEKSSPYTKIEAYISLRIDLDNGKQKGLREYSRIWNWSRNKTQLFFSKIGYKVGDTKGTLEEKKGDTLRTDYRLVLNNLDHPKKTEKGHLGEKKGTLKGHYYNTNTKYTSNFEKIWKKYPAGYRDGKKEAFRHYRASVQNEEDYKKINIALENYKKSKRVKSGYVKNGSTWFNNWQDWVEYEEVEKQENFPI